MSNSSKNNVTAEYQRLAIEYRRLTTEKYMYPSSNDISVEKINDDINKWKVTINIQSYNVNSKLAKELKEKNIQNLKFVVKFDNYPYKCPFVQLLSPKFVYDNNFINNNGVMCLKKTGQQ
jgi:ubiquitin-protein ligase